jgi:hypothetical protein
MIQNIDIQNDQHITVEMSNSTRKVHRTINNTTVVLDIHATSEGMPISMTGNHNF